MPHVFKSDLHRYVPKQEIQKMRKHQGAAIWLPDGKGLQHMNKFKDVEINGEGIMDIIGTMAGLMDDNKNAIKAAVPAVNDVRAERKKRLENAKNARSTTEGGAIYLPDISLSTRGMGGHSYTDDKLTNKILKAGKGFKILNPELK